MRRALLRLALLEGLVWLSLAGWLVSGIGSRAYAVPPRGTYQDAPSPSQGVLVPVRSVAEGDDASGLEVNPALIPFGGRLSAVYIHSELDDAGRRMGTGDAIFVSSKIIGMFALGASFQWLRPPTQFAIDSYGKLTFGFAYGGRTASFGFNVSKSFSTHTAGGNDLDDLVTLDAGLVIRPSRYLSFGAVAYDLTEPRWSGVPLQRVWELGLGVRPLGTPRWTVGADLRISERRGDFDPRAWLTVSPIPGLALRGDVEFYRRADSAVAAGEPRTDLRATAGFELTFDRTTGGAYALFGDNGPGARTANGASVLLRTSLDPVASLPIPPLPVLEITLDDMEGRKYLSLVAYLRRLQDNHRVAALLLKLDPGLALSWADAQELRELIGELRARGKRVFAYVEIADGKQIYLASACEKVFLNPAGGIRLVGLAGRTLYFKGTLDKLGVRAEFVKIGEFKSAPEAFTRSGPSDPARLQREVMIDDLYGQLLRGLAHSRRFTVAHVRELIDKGPYTAPEAKAARLVDELRYYDEIDDALKAELGRSVSLSRVTELSPGPMPGGEWSVPPSVAVIEMIGDMVDGKSRTIPILGTRMVGAESITKAIAQARDTPSVRAIVLRIDSPGGSAYAADQIYRELWKTRGKKPLIASMGGVAASGGYYVAAACDVIFAEPGTLTGSIGIFTGKVDVSGLLTKIGVTAEDIGRGKRAHMESFLRPYTDEERQVLQQKIQHFYERFLRAVADGRNLTTEQVNQVGRGRIWSGERAKTIKLVDELGGFGDALALAKSRAGLGKKRTQLVILPPPDESLLVRAIKLFITADGSTAQSPLPKALGELARWLSPVAFHEPGAPLTRLPFELVTE